MSTNIETRRVKEALQLQVAAVQTYAARLSAQDIDQLESDFVELKSAIAELDGIIESIPHRHHEEASVGASPASPATTRPEREAKGAETADVTQRRGE